MKSERFAAVLVTFLSVAIGSSITAAAIVEEKVEFRIKEGEPANVLVGHIKTRPGYVYALSEPNAWFRFTPESGEIRTSVAIDREQLSGAVDEIELAGTSVQLIIVAESPPYFIAVRILVEDINDNPPTFPYSIHNVTLSESASIGSRLTLPSATDADLAENGEIVEYRLLSDSGSAPFSLVRDSDNVLLLQVDSALDRETVSEYSPTVLAVDGGGLTGRLTLLINVLDANDNAPQFSQLNYEVSVNESLEFGSRIVRVSAGDADWGANGRVVYRISDDSAGGQFEIDSASGLIQTKVRQLDCGRRRRCGPPTNCSTLCLFTVEAWDQGRPAQRGRAFVHLSLLDENDHAPTVRFDSQGPSSLTSRSGNEVAVLESAQIGSVVAVATVVDEDLGANGETDLTVLSGNQLNHFSLDSRGGLFTLIRLAARLDRSKVDRYNLTLSAKDRGKPARETRTSLAILVFDSSDEPPQFDQPVYSAELEATAPRGSFVTALSASLTGSTNVAPIYKLIEGNDAKLFRVNEATGLIVTADELTGAVGAHRLLVEARSGTIQPSSAAVNITILPSTGRSSFLQHDYSVKLPENGPVPAVLLRLNVTEDASAYRFAFEADMDNGVIDTFAIDGLNGTIFLVKSLDRERMSNYNFGVRLVSGKSGETIDSADVHLFVLDENDNSPVFDPTEHHVTLVKSRLERGEVPQVQVRATDKDKGEAGKVVYRIISPAETALASLDRLTGLVRLNAAALLGHFQDSKVEQISLEIGATDGASRSASNAAVILIRMVESEEELPKFTEQRYAFSIPEDDGSQSAFVSGRVVGRTSATDTDSEGLLLKEPIQYRIVAGNTDQLFEVGRYSGEIRSRAVIDREKISADCCVLEIAAVGLHGSATATVAITVLDVNDNWPKFLSPRIAETQSAVEVTLAEDSSYVGMTILDAAATDADLGKNGNVSYLVKSNTAAGDGIIEIDERGLVSLRVAYLLLEDDSYTFEVVAVDGGLPSHRSSFILQMSTERKLWLARRQQLSSSPEYFISESTPANTFIGKLNFTAISSSSKLHFMTPSAREDELFAVFPDGWMYVKNVLDFEEASEDELVVKIVEENAKIGKVTSTMKVKFHITDVNDNGPTCLHDVFLFYLLENSPPLSYVGTVEAVDLDMGLNGQISYTFKEKTDQFYVDYESGEIFSLVQFNRESATTLPLMFSLTIMLSDHGESKRKAECAVQIFVNDTNDNAPVFTMDVYGVTVAEDQAAGAVLLTVTANDEDSEDAGRVTYQLISNSAGDNTMFTVDETTGKLFLNRTLNRESLDKVVLNISATDNAPPYWRASCLVIIQVSDVNDNAPIFTHFPSHPLNLSEETSVGAEVGHFRAVDFDEGEAAKLTYSILAGNLDGTFEIDSYTGKLFLVKQLDYELTNSYSVVVQASDAGTPALSSTVPLVVNVVDENDNAPIIKTTVARVAENSAKNVPFLTVAATDADSGANGRLSFELVEQFPESSFGIERDTGRLYPTKALDREEIDSYRLLIAVRDNPERGTPRTTERWLSLIVDDENDNSPRFVGALAASFDLTKVPLDDSEKAIGQLTAFDPDAGENGTVTFRMVQLDAEQRNLFRLSHEGVLYLTKSAGQQITWRPVYTLTVEASDSSAERRSTSTQFVLVPVPLFPSRRRQQQLQCADGDYNFRVIEDAHVGAVIGKVTAVDVSGGNKRIHYYLVGLSLAEAGALTAKVLPTFRVDENSGTLEVGAVIDRETMGAKFDLRVAAVLVDESEPAGVICEGTLNVGDVNDEAPTFRRPFYQFEIGEDAPAGAEVGRVFADDGDSAADRLSFSFSRPNQLFSVDKAMGLIRVKGPLEAPALHRLTVQASDGRQLSRPLSVSVRVTDVNDNAPAFERRRYEFRLPEGFYRSRFVGLIRAVDVDQGENSSLEYTLETPVEMFQLDKVTGVLTVDGLLDREERSVHGFRVTANDLGTPRRSSTAEVFIFIDDVNDNAPTFEHSNYAVTIPENSLLGTVVVHVTATDSDIDDKLQYFITSGDPWGLFSIDDQGTVKLSSRLDRERCPTHQLAIAVRDYSPNSNFSHVSVAHVAVSVLDDNDNAPVFDSPTVVPVQADDDNLEVGHLLAIIRATDADEELNGLVEYKLDAGHSSDAFSLDPVLGYLRLNREQPPERTLNLTVWAEDRGSPVRRTQANLAVHFLGKGNGNGKRLPRFLSHPPELTVAEDVPVGSSLLQLGVSYAERKHTFWIEGTNHFAVTPDMGVVFVGRPLDFESFNWYNITIFVGDKLSEAQNDSAIDKTRLIIRITDVNDNAPVFRTEPIVMKVAGNVRGPFPLAIGLAEAQDDDSGFNGKLSYSIVQGNNSLFQVDSITGVVSLKRSLSENHEDSYELLLQAADSGSPRLSTTGHVLVIVVGKTIDAPSFDQPFYTVSAPENTVQTAFLRVKGRSRCRLRYSIDESNEGVPFQIDQDTGELSATTTLDRETQSMWHFTVSAMTLSPLLSSKRDAPFASVNVTVLVLDENDNSPTSTVPGRLDLYVRDTLKSGDFVYGVNAHDRDYGENGRLTFELAGPDTALFHIDSASGVISVGINSAINQKDSYSVTVHISDNGTPQRSVGSPIVINFFVKPAIEFPSLENVDSNRRFNISEEKKPELIGTFEANSAKPSPFNRLLYSLLSGNTGGAFAIEQSSGQLWTTARLDREVSNKYELVVEVSDSDTPPLSSFFTVDILVIDQNDNAPQFSSPIYHGLVAENQPPLTAILQVAATDMDVGRNSRITYSFADDIDGSKLPFSIDAESGLIRTTKSLDREVNNIYEFAVKATDHGVTPSSSRAMVRVQVADENDNSPKFTRLFRAVVSEVASIGEFVMRVTSSDADFEAENTNNSYYLARNDDGKFELDADSGNLTVAGRLDRETKDVHNLRVAVVDGIWRVETELTVRISDVNDNAPRFTNNVYRFVIAELQPAMSLVGRVRAVDSDEGGRNSDVSYILNSESSGLFTINSRTGELLTKKVLHYRRNPTSASANMFFLGVTATDAGRPVQRSRCQVVVQVTQRRDKAPLLLTDCSQPVPLIAGADLNSSVIDLVVAHDDDATNSGIRYYNLEDEEDGDVTSLFHVDSVTGHVKTKASVGAVGTTYRLVVLAVDSGRHTLRSRCELTVFVVGPNKNSPDFGNAPIQLAVDENSIIGTPVGKILAVDTDKGLNGRITYSLSSSDFVPFTIDAQNGTVFVAGTLDYEKQASYNLTVVASDSGYVRRTTSTHVVINVNDMNDNPPVFASGEITATVDENSPSGTLVLKLSASDADGELYNKISYKIVEDYNGGVLSLDGDSGEISVAQDVLNFEEQNVYKLKVKAFNNGAEELSSVVDVIIRVEGKNEFPPMFSERTYNFVTGSQASNVGSPQPIFVGQVTATDKDGGRDGVVSFIWLTGSKAVLVDKRTGDVFLDPAAIGNVLEVEAEILATNPTSSSVGQTDKCSVNIRVENSAPLNFQPFDRSRYEFAIVEEQPIGTRISTVEKQHNVSLYRYRLEKGGSGSENDRFTVDSTDGTIRVNQRLDREEQAHYNFTVTAEKSITEERHMREEHSVDVSVVLLDVNDNGPVLTEANRVGHIREGDPPYTNIMTLRPVDVDSAENGAPFSFKMAGHNLYNHLFEVDKVTGIVRSMSILDRESQDSYKMDVEIKDSGTPPRIQLNTVEIRVTDVNDVAPTNGSVELRVVALVGQLENGSLIGPVYPYDLDRVGHYSCRMLDKNFRVSVKSNCQVQLNGIDNFDNERVAIRGSDGRHSMVDYTAYISLRRIDEGYLENAVQLGLRSQADSQQSSATILDRLRTFLQAKNYEFVVINADLLDSGLEALVTVTDGRAMPLGGNDAAKLLRTFADSATEMDNITVKYNVCTSEPCVNGGTCEMITEITAAVRSLSYLQLESGTALSFPAVRRSFRCLCRANFFGDHCENLIDPCAVRSPCQNGGTCKQVGVSSVACLCPPTYVGRYCEIDVDECKSSPCLNNGYCENLPGEYKCLCKVGFGGTNCETKVNFCQSNPCHNGGKCLNIEKGYSCSCGKGFSGPNCEFRAYSFDDKSFVELTQLRSRQNSLSMEFSTRSSEALLLYSYNQVVGNMDYIALDIVNGRLRLSARLTGLGQMNLMPAMLVNDGSWYQVQIEHNLMSVSMIVASCSDDGSLCAPCPIGNSTCQMTANTGLSQLLVSGNSVYLGGVARFQHLLNRPGQLAAFAFFGCIRAFEMNKQPLEHFLERSPADGHPTAGSCSSEDHCANSNVCGTGAHCSNRHQSFECRCSDGSRTHSQSCQRAFEPLTLSVGRPVQYELTSFYRRSLQFVPVAPETVVNSDDLLQSSLSETADKVRLGRRRRRASLTSLTPEVAAANKRSSPTGRYWMELSFRTGSSDGLLLFAAYSREHYFTIYIRNGTLGLAAVEPPKPDVILELDHLIVSDRRWHTLELALDYSGKEFQLNFSVDGRGAGLRFPHRRVKWIIRSDLQFLTIGALESDGYASLEKVQALEGCIRRFVLDSVVQPFESGASSGFLTVTNSGGSVRGCQIDCGRRSCGTSRPITESLFGKIILALLVIVFFAVLLVCACWIAFRVSRWRRQKLPSADRNFAGRKSWRSEPSENPFSISSPFHGKVSSSTGPTETNSMGEPRFLWMEQPELTRLSSTSRAGQCSVACYSNPSGGSGLDIVSQSGQGGRRYDLDNASSIASSDVDVALHYRNYGDKAPQTTSNPHLQHLLLPNNAGAARQQSPLRQLQALTAACEAPAPARDTSPASLRQLKASLRATSDSSPAESRVQHRRRKSSRRQQQKQLMDRLSVAELRRGHSNGAFEPDLTNSFSSACSSSRSSGEEEAAERTRRRRRSNRSRQSAATTAAAVAVELDLDAVCKPRKLIGRLSDRETETESELPLVAAGLHSLAPLNKAPAAAELSNQRPSSISSTVSSSFASEEAALHRQPTITADLRKTNLEAFV